MYHVKLASTIGAGENKGKPNLVEITSAKVFEVNESGDKVGIKFGNHSYVDAAKKEHIGIPGHDWSYPQFGPEPGKDDNGNYTELTEDQAQQAVDEMIKDAGGVVRFAENYNDATRTAALNTGKNYIRTKEGVTDRDAVIAEGIRRSKEFTWAAAERVTNKSVKEAVSRLAEEVDEIDDIEELKRRLKMAVTAGR